jgi:hypothetical protein
LYFKEVSFFTNPFANLVAPVFNELTDGGRFYCNLIRAVGPEAYISRSSTWSNPWPTSIPPGWEMPKYDPAFNLTFNEVSDQAALHIKSLIASTGKDCVLFYSGGIDSTVVLVSLLKNLTSEELTKIKLALSSESVIENPHFYNKFIKDKIQTIDATGNLYSDIITKNNSICITADLGDFIFGTELAVKLYPQLRSLENQLPGNIKKNCNDIYYNVNSENTHYSKYKDLLVLYFNNALNKGINNLKLKTNLPLQLLSRTDFDLQFGELLYEKINRNIIDSKFPIYSLHDFFWWTMFDTKFMWGALRPSVNYGSSNNIQYAVEDGIVNWFGSNEYQLWSMNNNNNGEKIRGTSQGSYKWAAKKYIYEFDKNEWYLQNKIKISSMPSLIKRSWAQHGSFLETKFGVDDQYNVIHINEPGINDYINTGLVNYKVDWI